MKKLVIYHANCPDGVCAAWVLLLYYGESNVELYPAKYGQPPPDVEGRDVIIVDFSYPRATLEAMKASARMLGVLDHHKTAREDLEDLPYAYFDMERSGAGLAWDFTHTYASRNGDGALHVPPRSDRPWLVEYVQARDIWKHKGPGAPPFAREALTALSTWPLDPVIWASGEFVDAICPFAAEPPGDLVETGRAILRYEEQILEGLLRGARRTEFAGHENIPVVNAPGRFASELGNRLSADAPFAVVWSEGRDRTLWFSLRSQGGADCSAIAKLYGGGGHKCAAGFSLKLGAEGSAQWRIGGALLKD